MNDLKLFEIAQQFRQLETLAIGDDLPAEVIRDTLESLEGDFKDKALQVAKFVLSLKAAADACDDAAKRMQSRAKTYKNRAEHITAYLLFNMNATGVRKIEHPEVRLNIRANPASVKLADGVELPPEFMRVPEPPPPSPDKEKIKAALQAGQVIDGAWLEQGERLDIRV